MGDCLVDREGMIVSPCIWLNSSPPSLSNRSGILSTFHLHPPLPSPCQPTHGGGGGARQQHLSQCKHYQIRYIIILLWSCIQFARTEPFHSSVCALFSFSSLLFLLILLFIPSPQAQFLLICFYSSPIPPQFAIHSYPSPHAQLILILLFSSPIPPQFASTQAPFLLKVIFLPILLLKPVSPLFASIQAPLLFNLLFLPIHLLTPSFFSFCFCSSPTPSHFCFYSSPIPLQLL